MAALSAGLQAPEISLTSLEGARFSLHDTLKKGPVVAVFFKVSCPVCQMALPYVQRIFKAYGDNRKLTMTGVSQDNAADTREFNREFGVTFPMLLEGQGYPISRVYGLTNVPTIFLISPDGEIEITIVSWSKREIEELNVRLAEICGANPAQIFRSGEQVPEFRPG
ncbi:MAG: TlpA family protein disulfide reductase [Candidatus Angelobacter sp.]